MTTHDNEVLRPKQLNDVIGSTDVLRRINISINAAKSRGDVLGHLCLYGPPGTGKTSIATCVANAIGTNLISINGAALKEPKDLIKQTQSIDKGDCWFIDEVHRIPIKVAEFLYPLMEDFQVMIPRSGNCLDWKVEPFCLIAATTHFGMLSRPLRDRFKFKYELSLYASDDLSKLVTASAHKLGYRIHDDAAYAIAKRSKGTPRVANNHLGWIRDYKHFLSHKDISLSLVEEAMWEQGIDELGLDTTDRNYLAALYHTYNTGPVGVAALANSINTPQETVADSHEPYLVGLGFIVRTPRGRELTTDGLKYAEKLPKPTRTV